MGSVFRFLPFCALCKRFSTKFLLFTKEKKLAFLHILVQIQTKFAQRWSKCFASWLLLAFGAKNGNSIKWKENLGIWHTNLENGIPFYRESTVTLRCIYNPSNHTMTLSTRKVTVSVTVHRYIFSCWSFRRHFFDFKSVCRKKCRPKGGEKNPLKKSRGKIRHSGNFWGRTKI